VNRASAAVVVGCIVALVAGAACQPVVVDPTPTAPPGGATFEPGATPTLGPPTSFGPPPSPSPDDTGPVILDPTLLAILPESINEFPVTESLDEAALALADPALPQIATALDAAVAVDAGTGNLVYALVVKVRPDAFDDGEYRQWRDSFDEGACTAAGGVVGNAEATIDGRTVYITSCAGSLHTYHLWLEEQDILISASSYGDGRFGEILMDNLRVPA